MKKYNNQLFLVWISIVVTVGITIISLSLLRTDEERRSTLLQKAQLTAQSINFEEISSLKGNNSDLNNNYYQRLKNELTTYRTENSSYRFTYLLGRKDDGTIFFFVDSERVSSDDYSPPGQIYEEASIKVKNAFKTKNPLIEGPVSDRWGTWISALVPILDNDTGEVIAIFGIDSSATLWGWTTITKTASIIILVILLIISSIIIIFANKKATTSNKTIMNQLMPPLVIIISLMLFSSLSLLLQQHNKTTSNNLTREHSEIVSDMHILLNEQSSMLKASALSIVQDKTMQNALRTGDRASLLAKYKGLFDKLHQENNVTHFYFFDTKRVCLLRIHKPEKYGDIINRATAIAAEQTGKTTHGIELGPLGTFTLRVVMPVYDGKTLLGYIEFGKEIEDVLKLIRLQTDFELAIAINKEFLKKPSWEDGMRLLNRQPEWDRLSKSVISYSTLGRLPDIFAVKANHNIINGHQHGDYNKDLPYNNQPWRLSILPLIDYSGTGVGGLIIFSNMSDTKESFTHTLTLTLASAFLLLLTLFGFIYSLLRRTDLSITEQQAKLYENNRRYDQLAEQSKTFNWETDANGLYTYVSHTVEKIIGYSPEELCGKLHFYDLHPKEGLEEFKNSALSAFANKVTFENFHNKILTKNCKIIWLNTNGFPVLDNLGNLFGYRGNDADITTRILTETALYESNEQLSATLRSISDGVITCDNFGNILLLNTIAEQLTGWKTSEAKGLPIEDVFHIINAETAEMVISPVRESLQNDIVVENSKQTVLLSKDNYKYQTDSSCSPIKDSEDTLIGAVLVFRNVTEKYIQEAELIKYSERLETSNQELAQFASIASHDLKAPLRGINNCATFLKIDFPDLAQPIQEKINYIIEITERLDNLIDELLAFSKLGNTSLTFNKCKLKDIVEESIENIKACDYFANAEINIKNLPENDLLCNKERLKYVYQNLITNGLKYNNKEHKYIEIGHFNENNQRIYYVYDNGIGIEEQYYDEIFQIFTRLHGKNEYSGGTGVGLAIVKKVIMQHNGTVWIKSKLNEGTTFYFTINV